mmetsp:Transcript_85237/g.170283  ORF Transcript_85237/g.170283 Transcript_85237/m.170283 type:complete len:250 (-) Transcript_85237:290-1039(-)
MLFSLLEAASQGSAGRVAAEWLGSGLVVRRAASTASSLYESSATWPSTCVRSSEICLSTSARFRSRVAVASSPMTSMRSARAATLLMSMRWFRFSAIAASLESPSWRTATSASAIVFTPLSRRTAAATSMIARLKVKKKADLVIVLDATGKSLSSRSRASLSRVAAWTTKVRPIAGSRSRCPCMNSELMIMSMPSVPPLVITRPFLAAMPRSITTMLNMGMLSERQKSFVWRLRAHAARNSFSMSPPPK